jgi:hypothetical protein
MSKSSRRRVRKEKKKAAQKKADAILSSGGQHQKNKGKRMAKKKNKNIFGFGGAAVTKPVVQDDPETLSVVLFKQSDLDKIAALCKPKAGGSEFQVHYRGAQFIIEHPDHHRRIAFTIPTYYFNMPQKVTTAAVDFNLDEVAAISEKIAPISETMVQGIAAAFPMKFFEDHGFTVRVRELEMGSIHRHPGDFGFSATDLDNQVENPGVIFRNLKCDDKIQVDSVMYIPAASVKIVTTETRIVTVAPSDDDGIEGVYNEAPTISYILEDAVNTIGFEDFFGGAFTEGTTYNFKTDQKWVSEKYPQITPILEEFLTNMTTEESEYQPGILVDPELIESPIYGAYNYHRRVKPATSPWLKDDDDEEYYSGFGQNQHLAGSSTKETKALQVRPLWRKTQSKSMLVNKGIKISNYPNITGNADTDDTYACAKALSDHGIDETEADAFFISCGYSMKTVKEYRADVKAAEETTKGETDV